MSQKASRITLSLRKGETAVLYVWQKPMDFKINELTSNKESWNAWGEGKTIEK